MKVSRSELCADTRHAYCAKIGVLLASIAAIIAFICALYTQGKYSDKPDDNTAIAVSCISCGHVRVRTQNRPKYITSHWDPSFFLSITLAFEEFSCATAKGIDVAWDFTVGGFGQIILAIIAYPVIRRSSSYHVSKCLKKLPVSKTHVKRFTHVRWSTMKCPSQCSLPWPLTRSQSRRYGS